METHLGHICQLSSIHSIDHMPFLQDQSEHRNTANAFKQSSQDLNQRNYLHRLGQVSKWTRVGTLQLFDTDKEFHETLPKASTSELDSNGDFTIHDIQYDCAVILVWVFIETFWSNVCR